VDDPIPDGMTELYDADVPRVDLVDKGANGMPFLIAKQADGAPGLLDADYVRSLIAKAEPEPNPQETVTMTGTPAAIAALIHGAPVRKAEPAPAEDTDNRAAGGPPKKADVEKAMETDDGIDGMDPTVVLAEPDMEAPGDPADPGSPAWEAIDAATARKWTSILARARTALGVMADRESLEAATGDVDDIDNAMDLGDAACAIDYAISVLAPFAVDEQAEADCGTDEMEMLGKAIAGLDPANLETVEALAPLAKAGRTLSSANEAALRAALQSLQQVLASLPKAPAAPGDATEMTKEESPEMSDNNDAVQAALNASTPLGTPKEPASAETPAAAGMPGEVAKAGAKPDQMAVYDSDGNLIGVVDPGDVTRLMSAKAPAPVSSDDAGTGGADEAADDMQPGDVQPTDDGTTPTDLAPAPADAVGTPADATEADDDGNVAKADTPNDTVPNDMLKSSISELVKAAVDERSAEQAGIVKQLEDRYRALEERNEALTQELAKQTASSEERFTVLENQPAVMAIASNGAIPPPHMMRGQDRGAPAAGALTKAQEMRDAFKASDDATKQQAYAAGLNALAIDELSRIHAAGPR
jgi:hypothetical protein